MEITALNKIAKMLDNMNKMLAEGCEGLSLLNDSLEKLNNELTEINYNLGRITNAK